MGVACSAYRVADRLILGFGGESEGKRTLGRPRRRWIFRKCYGLDRASSG